MKQIKQFIADIKKIIHEITWPDKNTLSQLTVVVIFVSALVGVVLGAIDFSFTKLLTLVTLK